MEECALPIYFSLRRCSRLMMELEFFRVPSIAAVSFDSSEDLVWTESKRQFDDEICI